MARMPLPEVLPTTTSKRLSARSCASAGSAAKRGITSTSPASSAATCAAGSLMKRKVARLMRTRAASRWLGEAASTMLEPRFQLSST